MHLKKNLLKRNKFSKYTSYLPHPQVTLCPSVPSDHSDLSRAQKPHRCLSVWRNEVFAR